MPAQRQDQKETTPGAPNAQTPERAPHESNYGYESDHPSYKQRGAGDWSPRFGATGDYRPARPPEDTPAVAEEPEPRGSGQRRQR